MYQCIFRRPNRADGPVTAATGVCAAMPQANRWRKRGLSVVPLKFSIEWDGAPYTVFVSVYSEDGTVAIAHAGIEVGQGINTKVIPCGMSLGCLSESQ